MSFTTKGTGPSRPHTANPADHNELGEYFDSLRAQAKDYVNTEKKVLTLFIYEKIGKAVGGLVGIVISAIAVILFLVFGSVALALYLGSLLASVALGFLIVAGLYLLVFIIVHFMAHKAIRNSTMLNVINSFYDEND